MCEKNMADEKRDMARAGTIEITSKEGKAFLEKNLTEWKKPLLMNQFHEKSQMSAAPDVDEKVLANKKKRGKDTKSGLGRKKLKIAKASTVTMEGVESLGNENVSDVQQETKAKPKSTLATKRVNTMLKTIEEAKAVCGIINSKEGRKLRKRSAPSTSLAKRTLKKKAGTMVKTSKEGKKFLKRGQMKPAKGIS